MIKLIAFDFDGTILDDGIIHKETIKTFNKLKKLGIKLIPCTGRSIDSLAEILKELGIYEKGNLAILSTGATIQDVYTKELIIDNMLDEKDYYYIRNIVEEELDLTVYTLDCLYYEDRAIKEFLDDAKVLNCPVSKLSKDFKGKIIRVNIMGKADKLDLIEEKYTKLLEDKYYVVRNMPFSIEILNKKASKGNAVKELAKMLDISLDDILTIGDGNNDISMLKITKNSVAMGNASDKTKSYASYITEGVKNNGFSKAIDKIIFDNY